MEEFQRSCSPGCPFSLVRSLFQSAERGKGRWICRENTNCWLPPSVHGQVMANLKFSAALSCACQRLHSCSIGCSLTKCFETELSKIIECVVTSAALSSFRGFVLIFNHILIFNTTGASI